MIAPAGPRLATLWAALVYAVATLLLGYPALAGQFLVNPRSDQYIIGYAFREFAAQSLRAGEGFPLWNPYLFGGVPFVAGMGGDIFYPTFLLRMMLPTDVAMTWGFMIHIFLAGLFTYLFLRAAGLGFYGALVGGLAYAMGGNIAGLVSPGHDGKIFVSALLPLVLFFVQRGVRDGRSWAWGGLAIAIMLAVLTPHPQLLQYLMLTSGFYALWLALSRPAVGEKLPGRVAAQRLGLAALAVGVGLLGGAVQFWPVVEYTPHSPRSGGAGWEHAISYSMPPEETLNFYLPQFSGILERYWGRNNIHHHSDYVGAAVLALAGLAFGAEGARRKFVWYWLGVFVIALFWSWGGFTPFYSLVYAIVPMTKYLRAPSTMLYVVSFAAAVLAAVGVERVLAGVPKTRYAVGWMIAAGVVALLATAGGLTNLGESIASPDRAEVVQANATSLTIGAWRSFLIVAAVGGVLFGLARGAMPVRAAGWALAAIVVVDLWSIERLYWRFSPPAAQLYRSDAVVDYLKQAQTATPGRVLPLMTDTPTGILPDPFFRYSDGRAGGLMSHGIRSVVGYHGNELRRYDDIIGWETDQYIGRISNPNVRKLTSMRWLYTNAKQPPLPGMRLVAGPVKNVNANEVMVYEFPDTNPPAWVTPMAVKAPEESILATVLDPRFDVRRVALFDTSAISAAVPAQPIPQTLPDPVDVPVRATRWTPGRISLTLERPAPQGSALVVSENHYPGWVATVDGKAAPVGRADYTLIGVALPAGARQVELTFTSPRYETGKTITWAAIILSLLAVGAGILADRRRGTPAPEPRAAAAARAAA